jgi:hypothetical protein
MSGGDTMLADPHRPKVLRGSRDDAHLIAISHGRVDASCPRRMGGTRGNSDIDGGPPSNDARAAVKAAMTVGGRLRWRVTMHRIPLVESVTMPEAIDSRRTLRQFLP